MIWSSVGYLVPHFLSSAPRLFYSASVCEGGCVGVSDTAFLWGAQSVFYDMPFVCSGLGLSVFCPGGRVLFLGGLASWVGGGGGGVWVTMS